MLESRPQRFCRLSRLEVGREAWDGFVEESAEAWLWHRFDLQDALATWPGRVDLSFAVMDNSQGGQIVALMPLHVTESTTLFFYRLKSLESLGGPACRNDYIKKNKNRLLRWLGEEIKTLATQLQALEINISLPPMAPAYRGEQCPRVNPLLYLGCENNLSQTWVINLQQGKEYIWEKMETRARTATRKALQRGVKVRAASKIDDIELYYTLHQETCNRTGAQPHPKSYFKTIWEKFVKSGMALFLFAEWQGDVVAAENFGIYKKASIYWTGAASTKGLELYANSLLQWEAMRWMVDHGIEWYETGEAYPHLQSGKLKSLHDFKKSFGGDLYPYYKGKVRIRKNFYNLLRFLQEALQGHRSGK